MVDIVVVYIDVDAAASPATIVAPTAAPRGTQNESGPKRKPHSRYISWIDIGRIRVCGRTIDDHRIVGGDIDHLGAGLLYDNHLLAAIDDLGFHFLLLGGLQAPRPLCLGAHALDSGQHIHLLRQKGVAQFRRPLNIACQSLHNVRHSHHGLNAWIPALLLDRIRQCLSLQGLVPVQPLLQLNHLQRVGGGHQRLAQQRIGIKRDGRDQRIQLLVGNFRNRIVRRGARHGLLAFLTERYGGARHE